MVKDGIIKLGAAVSNINRKFSPYLYCGNLDNILKKLSRLGYDCAELHISDPKEIDKQKIINSCKINNISISGISTGLSYYYNKISLIDESNVSRDIAIKSIKEYIDLAYTIGGFVMIGNIRGRIPDRDNYKKHTDILADSIGKICSYAENKNVVVVLEATNRYESNYLNNAMQLHEFIEEYKISNLKMHLDTFHMNIEENDICKSIKKYSKHLKYFHVSDNNRNYPGDGSINFKKIINVLHEISYKDDIVIECLPYPNPEEALTKSKEYIGTLYRLIS